MPEAPSADRVNFRSGAIINLDKVVLLSGLKELDEENVAHTLVSVWRRSGEWSGKLIEWTSATACRGSQPGELLIMGEDCDFMTLGPRGSINGRVADSGVLCSSSAIDDVPFVVGMRGLVYQWSSDRWSRFAEQIPADVSFEAIDGFSESELYAVGWKGCMWMIRPEVKRLDSLTNLILTSICCAPNGLVYACGQKGLLIKGRGAQWEIIDHNDTREDLWSACWFKGKLFVSSTKILYKLQDGHLVRVRFEDDMPTSFYRLMSYQDSILWSIGSQDVFEYDGSSWTRII